MPTSMSRISVVGSTTRGWLRRLPLTAARRCDDADDVRAALVDEHRYGLAVEDLDTTRRRAGKPALDRSNTCGDSASLLSNHGFAVVAAVARSHIVRRGGEQCAAMICDDGRGILRRNLGHLAPGRMCRHPPRPRPERRPPPCAASRQCAPDASAAARRCQASRRERSGHRQSQRCARRRSSEARSAATCGAGRWRSCTRRSCSTRRAGSDASRCSTSSTEAASSSLSMYALRRSSDCFARRPCVRLRHAAPAFPLPAIPMRWMSRLRARAKRDMTVPMGIESTLEISW